MWIELVDELEASIMVNLDNVLSFRPRPNGAGTEIRMKSANVDVYVRDNYTDLKKYIMDMPAGTLQQYPQAVLQNAFPRGA